MTSPADTAMGSLLIAVIATVWLMACRPPARVVRLALSLGCVLFLPYFLLTPLLPDAPQTLTGDWLPALAVPWSVFIRGISGMLVSISTVTVLSGSDFYEAMTRLPVPHLISAILLQIVHQTGTLYYETKRIAAAMAVRGAARGGVAAWRVLSSLPRVWLPRVIERAERVSWAMELRGYSESGMRQFRQTRTRDTDCAVLIMTGCVFALAAALRIWRI